MDIKSIFIAWEKLRIQYNLVLLIVFIAITALYFTGNPSDNQINKIAFPIFILKSSFLAFIANILYFSGPIFDSYLSWLELKFKYKRHLIFFVGLLFSITLELIYLDRELFQR